MIYSMTASHFDCEIKDLLLKYTLESLIKNGIDICFLSVSFDGIESYNKYKDKIINLKNIFQDKLKIFIHYQKLYQFQHLNFICNRVSIYIKDNDKIIFCDDDDILINLPEINDHEVISGYQYLTNFVEDDKTEFNNLEKIVELMKTPIVNSWDKISDFSGYICTYKIFKDFIENNKDKFNFEHISPIEKLELQLTDCKFMNYLDTFKSFKPVLPFIYHRIWITKDRQIQQWRQNMLNSIEILDKNVENSENNKYIKSIKNIKNIKDNLKKNNRVLIVGFVLATFAIFAKYKFKIF